MKRNTIGKSFERAIFLLFLGASLFSCSEADDVNSIKTGFVSSISTLENGYYYQGCDEDLYPLYQTYDNMRFNIAFIRYNDIDTTGSNRHNIRLLSRPVSVERDVALVNAKAKLDSLKNDSIISFESNSFVANYYLVLSVNYYLSGNTKHSFTLCYADDKGFASSNRSDLPDTLKLELRHNSNNDVASNKTSHDNISDDENLVNYYMGFDIGQILYPKWDLNKLKNIYVDVRANTSRTNKRIESHVGLLCKFRGLIL